MACGPYTLVATRLWDAELEKLRLAYVSVPSGEEGRIGKFYAVLRGALRPIPKRFCA
jgi:hypothetical protein